MIKTGSHVTDLRWITVRLSSCLTGTYEDTILMLLTSRSNNQRQEIKVEYKKAHGKVRQEAYRSDWSLQVMSPTPSLISQNKGYLRENSMPFFLLLLKKSRAYARPMALCRISKYEFQ